MSEQITEDIGIRAMRLLEQLTPGGSEFAGEPETCARYIREGRDRNLERIKDLIRQRNAIEAENERLRALVTPRPDQTCWCIERNFSNDPANDDWQFLTWTFFDEGDLHPVDWVPTFWKSTKFFDRESAEQVCAEMPDYWAVRIVEHSIGVQA